MKRHLVNVKNVVRHLLKRKGRSQSHAPIHSGIILALQPGRGWQSLGRQEFRVEQFGLIAGAGIA